jgi:hypothetical protein
MVSILILILYVARNGLIAAEPRSIRLTDTDADANVVEYREELLRDARSTR